MNKMKTIPIPFTSKVAIVDDDDYEKLKDKDWGVSNGYVFEKGNTITILMHWLVLSPTPGMVVDHINRDKLDNRKENLRLVTPSQNRFNSRVSKRNTSGYKGVSYVKENRRWSAEIYVRGTKIYLGRFSSAEKAAKAYDEAAKKHVGQFAKLNFS